MSGMRPSPMRDDPFEPGQLGTNRLEHLQVLRSLHLLGGDDGPASRYAKRVFQLGETIGRIDIYEDEAEVVRSRIASPATRRGWATRSRRDRPCEGRAPAARRRRHRPRSRTPSSSSGRPARGIPRRVCPESRGRLCEQRRNREIAERQIRCAAHVTSPSV